LAQRWRQAGWWPLLSPAMQDKLPARQQPGSGPRAAMRARCWCWTVAQPAMAPNINAATARVLDALGVQLLVAPRAGCCGACATT
jgi:glycolate oxidase iron-sulfur subunit